MSVRGRIIYTGGSPRAMIGVTQQLLREGHERAARYWHRVFMPKHFTVAGAREYGYQPRSGELGPGGVPMEPPRIPSKRASSSGAPRMIANPKYAWRKRRQKGHGRPNVWSGRSEIAARAAVRVSSRWGAGETVGSSETTSGRTINMALSKLQGVAVMPLLPRYFYQYITAGTYTRRLYGRTTSVTFRHTTPNKADELTRSTPQERRVLGQVVLRHVERGMQRSRAARTETVAA